MEFDFSRPYRDVGYFGVWADESADAPGKRNALTVLHDAARRCHDQDMRTEEVRAALDYLTRHGGSEKRAQAFRKALDIADPELRRMAVRTVYKVMARGAAA